MAPLLKIMPLEMMSLTTAIPWLYHLDLNKLWFTDSFHYTINAYTVN